MSQLNKKCAEFIVYTHCCLASKSHSTIFNPMDCSMQAMFTKLVYSLKLPKSLNLLLSDKSYLNVTSVYVCVRTQSCLAFCNPMDHSPPGSTVHGIFQARILEWVVISCSKGSSQPRDWTWVFRIAGRYFNIWASPVAQLVKNLHAMDLIPWVGNTPGEGKGSPLQYSGLENSMDYSPWGRKESDMTEPLSLSLFKIIWATREALTPNPSSVNLKLVILQRNRNS